MHGGRLSDELEVNTVQTRMPAVTSFFLVVLGWVTTTSYASSGKDIHWTLMRKIEDMDFADDVVLLLHHLQDMQNKVNSLGKVSVHRSKD